MFRLEGLTDLVDLLDSFEDEVPGLEKELLVFVFVGTDRVLFRVLVRFEVLGGVYFFTGGDLLCLDLLLEDLGGG